MTRPVGTDSKHALSRGPQKPVVDLGGVLQLVQREPFVLSVGLFEQAGPEDYRGDPRTREKGGVGGIWHAQLPTLAHRLTRRCSQRMDCLTQCGLRDGIARFGQFCIDLKLAAAMRGEVSRGLFFRGASKLSFGDAMGSVRELMDYLLNGRMPTAACIS